MEIFRDYFVSYDRVDNACVRGDYGSYLTHDTSGSLGTIGLRSSSRRNRRRKKHHGEEKRKRCVGA